MTAINITTDIPSNINTLERLAAWSIMALRRTNPTQKVLEVADTTPVNVAQAALIQAEDGSVRFFGRVSISVESDYAEDNVNKLWMKAEELSNTTLPEAFKTN
ncbi:MAG: hypothetical protein QNJ34_19350 [Xenococcaceae cyanobacterium MO_188.B29]|nr:hypothetical protein [Xenococcaceae cyanobacterium MO_188.B29]